MPGGAKQQASSVGATALHRCDLSAQMLSCGSSQRVSWSGVDRNEELAGCIESTGVTVCPRSHEQALCAAVRLWRQGGGTGKERGGGGHPTAGVGANGRALQLLGDFLLGLLGGLCPVPGADVRIELRADDRRAGHLAVAEDIAPL